MTIFYCRQCYETVLSGGGEDLWGTFAFICELASQSKQQMTDVSWVRENKGAYERVKLLESKGAIISHETDKAIILRPNHVYFMEELKCKEGCCPGFVFCVEGGHVSVAKE